MAEAACHLSRGEVLELRRMIVQRRVYDPCCSSSGTFVQLVGLIRAREEQRKSFDSDWDWLLARARVDISVHRQKSTYSTWRLATMNLAVHGSLRARRAASCGYRPASQFSKMTLDAHSLRN